MEAQSPSPLNRQLKFALHSKLLERIDLQYVAQLPPDRLCAELRPVITRLIGEEKTPISLAERGVLIEEVLDEVFGLGPLEPLLHDRGVSDILVTPRRYLQPVIYSLGLGGTTSEPLDQDFLRRVANDPQSSSYAPARPVGHYYYAADITQLSAAYQAIASQILRLSQ